MGVTRKGDDENRDTSVSTIASTEDELQISRAGKHLETPTSCADQRSSGFLHADADSGGIVTPSESVVFKHSSRWISAKLQEDILPSDSNDWFSDSASNRTECPQTPTVCENTPLLREEHTQINRRRGSKSVRAEVRFRKGVPGLLRRTADVLQGDCRHRIEKDRRRSWSLSESWSKTSGLQGDLSAGDAKLVHDCRIGVKAQVDAFRHKKPALLSLLGMAVLTLVLRTIEVQYFPEFYDILKHGDKQYTSEIRNYRNASDPTGWLSDFTDTMNSDVKSFMLNGHHSLAAVLGASLIILLLMHTFKRKASHLSSCRKRTGVVTYLARLWNARVALRAEVLVVQVMGASAQILWGILGSALAFSFFVDVTSFVFRGVSHKLFGFPDIYLGYLLSPHEARSVMQLRPVYMVLFLAGFTLDIWGLIAKFRVAREFSNKYLTGFLLLCVVTLLGATAIFTLDEPSCSSADSHWLDFSSGQLPIVADVDLSSEYPPLHFSQYVSVGGGEKAAVDIYLPRRYYKYIKALRTLDHERTKKSTNTAFDKPRSNSKTERDFAKNTGNPGPEPELHNPNITSQANFAGTHQYYKSGGAVGKDTSGGDIQADSDGHSKGYPVEEIEEIADNDLLRLLIAEDDKLPVFLNITRYNRSTFVQWPFTMLRMYKQVRGPSANLWNYRFQQALVVNGYAVVQVDTRGTGASSGKRWIDLSETEIKDFSLISEWVRRQWFSNGKIGSGGVSYDGMTGLLNATRGGADAVVSLFSPLNVLEDLIAPGGVLCSSFVSDYSGMTKGFEKHGSPRTHLLRNALQYPLHVLIGFLVSFGGPSAVRGFESEMQNYTSDHHHNWEMENLVEQVQFMDDRIILDDDAPHSLETFGVKQSTMEALRMRKVHAYIVGGYCDSASTKGAISLFNHLQQEKENETLVKLTVGGWTHGGKRGCSPYSGNFSCFEKSMYLDILRFLDCSLMKKCWGNVRKEKDVHYWQIGDENWVHADEFPNIPPTSSDASHGGSREDGLFYESVYKKSQVFKLTGELLEQGVRSIEPASVRRSPNGLHSLREWPLRGSSWIHTIHDLVQNLYLLYTERYSKVILERSGKKPSRMGVLDIIAAQESSYFMLPTESGDTKQAFQKRTSKIRNDSSAKTNAKSEEQCLLDVQEQGGRNISAPECAADAELKGTKPSILQSVEAQPRDSAASIKSNRTLCKGSHCASVATPLKYTIDYRATSGIYSRWFIAQHPFGIPVHYGNRGVLLRSTKTSRLTEMGLYALSRHNQSGVSESSYALNSKNATFSDELPDKTDSSLARVLSWTSAPVSEAIRIAGAVEVRLSIYVESCSDFFVFAYLEDVDIPNNRVHYITEGNLMPTHRPVVPSDHLWEPQGTAHAQPTGRTSPRRTFKKKDYRPIDSAGEIVEVSISMQPTAWTLRQGHALRVSLTGNDTDNFDLAGTLVRSVPSSWHVFPSSLGPDDQWNLTGLEKGLADRITVAAQKNPEGVVAAQLTVPVV